MTQDHSTDDLAPASLRLFERRNFAPRWLEQTPVDGYRLAVLGEPNHIRRRSEEIVLAASELSRLGVELGYLSELVLRGSDTETYRLNLHAEVKASTPDEASHLLQKIVLRRQDHTFVLDTPPPSTTGKEQCHPSLLIDAPASRAVNVTGRYAAIAVTDVHAPTSIVTTNARLAAIDTSDLDAHARGDGGWIIFSGGRGRIRLKAQAAEIKLTLQSFDGEMEASAIERIGILLPRGFASPFEVDVPDPARLRCRAHLGTPLVHQRKGLRSIFTSGQASPGLRFVSENSFVIIDEYDAAALE